MSKLTTAFALLGAVLAFVVPMTAVVWVMAVPQRLGLLIYPEQVAAFMLGASLAAVYGRDMAGKGPLVATIDAVLSLASLVLGIYVYLRFPVLSEGAFYHPTESSILGVVVSVLVLEGLRRVVGWTLVVITLAMFLYALFGDLVPGPLRGRGLPFGDVMMFVGTDSSATWGAALQIAAFVVVVFVLFGGLLLAIGGGEFFTQLAMRVAGSGPGNTAKIAIVASGLFGSISGSAVSNVMSTGVLTIPMMKRSGFRPEQAGAIEAVASTGGQLAPPVMGAAAFLMAEILQIPYREILLAALFPALIYYLSLYAQIDFIARREGFGAANWLERDTLAAVFTKGWPTLVAFLVLIGLIFFRNAEAEVAAIWALLVLVVIALAAWAFGRGGPQLSPREIVAAIARAGGQTCDILLITAAAGMIIGLLSTTGLGFQLSFFLIGFGGQNLFGLLLITAVVGIVLGLGLPTTGVYLLLASMAAPALVQLGIPPLAAHMFVFYYGMLSMITPPIALAAFAAASIAEAPQLKTGIQAFRFGWVAYLLPFLFIYKPGLLMAGPWWENLYVFASSLVALILVAGGMIGHGLTPLGLAQRLLFVLIGLLIIAPLRQFGPPLLEFGVSAGGIALLVLHGIAARGATARPSSQPQTDAPGATGR
ncbi:TRAP transporter fused permease subunit [Jiella endophytica]|uniref:TRAP transporter fused permease subunit n=1 Tax=Jiella endophytica TaxID=2558362 RepID=A0A4Y8RTV1_9HYPH|nr:TRAP transporter fused permease subunit [Jiella endophytica]TFF27680.1 TRAP transporter fused permease subunit [Jiella endophytica]